MEKPSSLSMKHFLIRKLAVDLQISEKIIEIVINHAYNRTIEAFTNCNSVEVAGFGKFTFNEKKALRVQKKYMEYINKYNRELLEEGLTEKKKHNLELKLMSANRDLNILNGKLYGH